MGTILSASQKMKRGVHPSVSSPLYMSVNYYHWLIQIYWDFICLYLFYFFRGTIPQLWRNVYQVHYRRITRRSKTIATGYTLRLDHSARSAALRSVFAYLNKIYHRRSTWSGRMVPWTPLCCFIICSWNGGTFLVITSAVGIWLRYLFVYFGLFCRGRIP